MTIKRKSKKAEEVFLPEIVKIILAVIVIGILIFLAVGLYQIFTRSTELEQAKSLMAEIEAKVEQLEEGDFTDILVLAPRGWRIIAYGNQLCICPEKEKTDEQKNTCIKEGICNDFKYNMLLVGSSTVCIIPAGWFGNKDDIYDCFSLRKIPRELFINLQGEKLFLSSGKKLDIDAKIYDYNSKKLEEININGVRKSQDVVSIDLAPFISLNENYIKQFKKDSNAYEHYLYLEKSEKENRIDIKLKTRLDDFKTGEIDNEGYIWFDMNNPFIFEYSSDVKTIIGEKDQFTKNIIIPQSPDIIIRKTILYIDYNELIKILKSNEN